MNNFFRCGQDLIETRSAREKKLLFGKYSIVLDIISIFFLLQDASVRMEKFLCSSPADIAKFMALGRRAQEVVVVNLKKDEDYDDAPDEFIGGIF